MTTRRALALGCIAVPVLVFYFLLAAQTVDIPFMDDYGMMHFVSTWSQTATAGARVMKLLTVQHNEYKIVLADAVGVLDYSIAGRLQFNVLAVLGNLYVLGVLGVVYAIWKRDTRAVGDKLVLFIPVPWLLMQLQYYSLLNWPLTTLVNLGALFFCLLTIYLLSLNETRALPFAIVTLLLAICSSGNGFFVVPIGCALLLQWRRARFLVVWLAASACLLLGYIYHYNFHSSQAHADHSVVSSLYHLSPLYALSMLGASVARYSSYVPAALLGVVLCVVFGFAIRDKLYASNPALFYSMVFLLINALAVSGLRSDLGIEQSLVSRYRIYSNLMLVFAYLYLAGRWRAWAWATPRRRLAVCGMVMALVIAFNAASSYGGYKLLRVRAELTREGVRRWEHGEPSMMTIAGPAHEDSVIHRQRLGGSYEPNIGDLREAMALHIYTPPLL